MKRRIGCLLVIGLFLSSCAEPAVEASPRQPEAVLPTQIVPTETTVRSLTPQLLAKAESEAQAEEIARLYGITLVRFRRGLAAFYTEENPADVMARREATWPELYHNNLSQAF